MKGNQLIGNKESAEGDSTFNAINPVSGESIEPAFHEATQDEINSALANNPVRIAPTVPPTPWTAKVSNESSKDNLILTLTET